MKPKKREIKKTRHESGLDLEHVHRAYEDSVGYGKSLRETTPRSTHARWIRPANRRDPVEWLIESSAGREPDLIPIRYGRMLQSPFTFYRGAALIMAADLATTPVTGIKVQACGDCHLLNFGFYGTPERRVVFDINDFDETMPAPWEWDVKRLAASFVIASLHNGLDRTVAQETAERCVTSYRTHMKEYAGMNMLQLWYESISVDRLMAMSEDAEIKQRMRKRLEKAADRSVVDEDFPKLAEMKDGRARIKDNPPLIYHYPKLDLDERKKHLTDAYENYLHSLSDEKKLLLAHYNLHDFAAKVVGVGSVGTRCGIMLWMSADNHPLFMQVKEARPSVLEHFVGKGAYANNGQRVVNGQKLMQAASDMFLGWTKGIEGRHYYLRQLRDMKIKPMVEIFDEKLMMTYAGVCGWALARAHARSGQAPAISGYLGSNDKFDKAISSFAMDYSVQNERDFHALKQAIRKGKLEAYFEK